MERQMKIYIRISPNNISFQNSRYDSRSCPICRCGHYFNMNEFYMGVVIPLGSKDCLLTKKFYKTFAKRLRLKIRSNV